MARKLKDIETTEISFVDEPATRKKFLFYKQAEKKTKQKMTKISIESDGTTRGTKIQINGEELEDIQSFSFSTWSNSVDENQPVSCSYSKFVEDEDGFKRSETFYLTKGDTNMDNVIQELLKSYEEEEVGIDFEKKLDKDAIKAIKDAMATVNKYKGDFPDDLKTALANVMKGIAKLSVEGYGYPEKKEKEDVSKAGAKFSKDTMEKLKKAIEALEALKAILPGLKEETQKSATSDESENINRTIEKLNKSIGELEDKKSEASKTALTKTLEELAKRLEVVEKGTRVKKSVEGQDDDTTNKSKVEDKWPSIKITD